MITHQTRQNTQIFSGNIYIFHAFDVGEEINLDRIQQSHFISTQPLKLPKYFKNYHIPVSIKLPGNDSGQSSCTSVTVHNFGAISLTYKIPFKDTLYNL